MEYLRHVRPQHEFFPTNRVAVLGHRGLARGVPENSLAAFRMALDAGADVLECDVRATRDGVAVIAHDETLLRVFDDSRRVVDVDYAELRRLGSSPSESIVSVLDALTAFPLARFNIDVKSMDVVTPLARAIDACEARDRVLITSFSARRRRRALRLVPGVATSASAEVVVPVVLLCAVGLPWLVRPLSRRTPVLQIPTSVLGINIASRRMISRLHAAGFSVQFWTINNPDDMTRLVNFGANGIVTDRADIAVATFRHG